MNSSILYKADKDIAVKRVREILIDANYVITNEKVINNGCGYKYACEGFGVVLYFKEGISSKIVFENAPEGLDNHFDICVEENILYNENQNERNIVKKNIPIYSTIRIESQSNQDKIKSLIKAKYQNIEESKATESISYKFNIRKEQQKFSVTQFTNGTLLLQGLFSTLFTEILDIVQNINPLSFIENTIMYVSKNEQEQVKKAIEEIPDLLPDIYKKAQWRISKDAFEYLYPNDQRTLVSAVGILETVKEKDLKIPLYNPILYPFAVVFEGFLIRLLIDKCFFTFEDYRKNPEIAKIGNVLKNKKLEKYIRDLRRNGFVLDKLNTTWESLRCHELHADPAQDDAIINLDDISQVENRIGEISSAIIDGYRILVKNGYTESEMLQRKNTTF